MRPNNGLINVGDAGRIMDRRPKDTWAVRFAVGAYLIDRRYFKPLELWSRELALCTNWSSFSRTNQLQYWTWGAVSGVGTLKRGNEGQLPVKFQKVSERCLWVCFCECLLFKTRALWCEQCHRKWMFWACNCRACPCRAHTMFAESVKTVTHIVYKLCKNMMLL